jgi:hypothetical protein
MRVLVETIEAQNSFARIFRTGGGDIERQAFIVAAEAAAVRDRQAHSRLLDDNRSAFRMVHCSALL